MPDNGGKPARVTGIAFTLQLQGPFSTRGRAGAHLLLLSVPLEGWLLVLIHVYKIFKVGFSRVGSNYMTRDIFVKHGFHKFS